MDAPIQPGETWKLVVKGRPVPQGDLTAMPVMRGKKGEPRTPVLGKGGVPMFNQTHSNEESLKPWRAEIAACAAQEGWGALGLGAIDDPLELRLTFVFKRPLTHYGTGRNAGVLKDSAPLYPETTGADVDKLTRAIMDALTDVVWKDDKQVVTLRQVKRRYGAVEQVEIAVRRPFVRTVGDLRLLRDLNPLLADGIADQLELELVA